MRVDAQGLGQGDGGIALAVLPDAGRFVRNSWEVVTKVSLEGLERRLANVLTFASGDQTSPGPR